MSIARVVRVALALATFTLFLRQPSAGAGSDTSSLQRFVDAVSPSIAVISCGKKGVGTNSRYKHSRASTVRTYNNLLRDNQTSGRVWAFDADTRTWRQLSRREGLWITTKDGTVKLRSDGAAVRVADE